MTAAAQTRAAITRDECQTMRRSCKALNRFIFLLSASIVALLLWLACLIVPKFVGRHRIPSVFHDVYCDTRTRPSPEVHWMFYECLRCKGVVSIVAWIEWKGVLWFGPRF